MDKHQLEQIAKNAAALHGRDHSYTHGSGFTPHEWVIKAMEAAIEEASYDLCQEGYEEGHADGYSQGYDSGYEEGLDAS